MYGAVTATRRDEAAGAIAYTPIWRVEGHRATAARPIVLLLDTVHHVEVAVERVVETRAEHGAQAAVAGCMARGAVARARRHVAGLRRAGGATR